MASFSENIQPSYQALAFNANAETAITGSLVVHLHQVQLYAVSRLSDWNAVGKGAVTLGLVKSGVAGSGDGVCSGVRRAAG